MSLSKTRSGSDCFRLNAEILIPKSRIKSSFAQTASGCCLTSKQMTIDTFGLVIGPRGKICVSNPSANQDLCQPPATVGDIVHRQGGSKRGQLRHDSLPGFTWISLFLDAFDLERNSPRCVAPKLPSSARVGFLLAISAYATFRQVGCKGFPSCGKMRKSCTPIGALRHGSGRPTACGSSSFRQAGQKWYPIALGTEISRV